MDSKPSKACQHETDHGEKDEGLAGLGLPLVVAVESAVRAQPAEGALDHPPAGQDFERVLLGAFDDLDGAADDLAAPLQQGSRIAPVGPEVLDPPPRRAWPKKAESNCRAPARS